MSVIEGIAILLGLAGVVLGGLAWWKASEAKAIATGSYRAAQESKHAAADAQRGAVEASAAARAEIRATTTKASLGEPVDVPVETRPRADVPGSVNRANIVVRSGSNPGEDLPTNQGTGSGLLGIFLVNEGPAVAHDMKLLATFPNGTTRRSETHRTLSAHKELTLYAQVVPPDFGGDDPFHVLYQISYQDGDGDQTLERSVRVEGGWKGPWKTFIEAKN